MGPPRQGLEGPAKADGSWRHAADVRLPGMLFASARLAPPGGRLQTFDREALSRFPGVRHVTANNQWIAVVAETWWAAEQAIRAASPRFSGQRVSPDLRPL